MGDLELFNLQRLRCAVRGWDVNGRRPHLLEARRSDGTRSWRLCAVARTLRPLSRKITGLDGDYAPAPVRRRLW
jgi:hypothetical protein